MAGARERTGVSAYNVGIGVKQRLYPYEGCIRSALTVADEFVVAFDERFDAAATFSAIDPRVKPLAVDIDFLEWDFMCTALTKARRACSGDWCLYLEMDEVLHEKDAGKIVSAVHVAEEQGKNAVNIRYVNPYQDYILPNEFNNSGACRQKLTANKAWLYHKTSDYMIDHMDSDIWGGKALRRGFDGVAYYDERSQAWFHEANCPYPDVEEPPPAETAAEIEQRCRDYTYVWHYCDYNGSRKLQQGRQTAPWYSRFQGRVPDLDVAELSALLNEQITLDEAQAAAYLDYAKYKLGGIRVQLPHPVFAHQWIDAMRIGG